MEPGPAQDGSRAKPMLQRARKTESDNSLSRLPRRVNVGYENFRRSKSSFR